MATHALAPVDGPQSWTRSALSAATEAVLADVASRREAASAACDVPVETIASLREAGLFRAFQPVAWGGMELDPRIMLDLQNILAQVCPSTAWVYGVLSVQSFLMGRLDPRAQADVWGQDRDMLISSSFAPVGAVTPVDGGYRISGRFTFSSGSSHAGWAMVGGMAPAGEGRQMRLFLVPRADYRIDPVWDTIGLRATGSNDLVIEDAFVPHYRTYAPDAGLLPLPRSSGLAPLYRLPWLYMFTSTIANVGVGAGRGALAAFTEITQTRKHGFTNAPARDNAAYLSVIGRTRAEIDAIDQIAHRNFATLIDHVERDADLPMETALVCRAQLTGSVRRIASLVDEMILLLGGRGIRNDSPFTRFWLDMCAARAHPGNDPAMTHAQLAGQLLGPMD